MQCSNCYFEERILPDATLVRSQLRGNQVLISEGIAIIRIAIAYAPKAEQILRNGSGGLPIFKIYPRKGTILMTLRVYETVQDTLWNNFNE